MFGRAALFSLAVLFLAGCTSQPTLGGDAMEVSFSTADGVKISAAYYEGNGKGVILVPMLGRAKETYSAFAQELNGKGHSVLAIDMRGHGKSSGGNYNDFSSEQWNLIVKDIEAAKSFLKKKNVKEFAVIGASIGANLAIKYGASDSETSKIVMLSPAFDYHGVKTREAAKSYKGELLVVSSKDDFQSYTDSKELADLARNGEFIGLENAGHGTNMLGKQGLNEKILEFLGK